MELPGKSGFALALVLSLESADAFDTDLREVKSALLKWRSDRGARCQTVILTVMSPPDAHAAIESRLAEVYRGELELAPLLQSFQVEVALLTRSGKPVRKYTLGQPPPPPRPWWKFW
jgi:hypothetical protein